LWLHGVTPRLDLPTHTTYILFHVTFPEKLIIIHSRLVLGHIDVVKQRDETPLMGKQMDYVEAT
jgi:hypothetical protein